MVKVGIIRNEPELKEAIKRIERLKERARKVHVDGHRQYNPGWHTALDLESLLTVAECSAVAALERKESRGGHTRDDFPKADPEWGKKNVVARRKGADIELRTEPLPKVPDDLQALLGEDKPTGQVAVPAGAH